ncbi:MAG: ATP-binding domain-containing protein [Polyangiaceae bacterium]|nr:ATP-binding domain-containing protein [Polyangiaceae bacterium]
MRYWLALVRYQQALAVRPDARPPVAAATSAIHLGEPTAGQDYAKLGYAGRESFLVDRQGEPVVQLSHEWPLFFEDWLAARYRRGDDEETALEQLVFYPALRLPRAKLGGLLRFPVASQWLTGEGVFTASTYAERKKGTFRAPPDRVRLQRPSQEPEGELPFFIDVRILVDVLHVDAERVDECLAALRAREAPKPREVVRTLAKLIERQVALEEKLDEPSQARPSSDSPDGHEEPGVLLSRLHASIVGRLAQVRSSCRAFPLALVVSGDRSRSTWYLERDIEAGIDLWKAGRIGTNAPLFAYLTGRAPPATPTLCSGRWRGAGLTESQRIACELALGSRCSAVQGPPGTGKTTLILNMMAHVLVRKVSALQKAGSMGTAIIVASSTNNRAVDNVVDPLGRQLGPDQLGLSLRVGSRRVFERVTLPQLERARQWIETRRVPAELATAALDRELARFRLLLSELETALGAERTYYQSLERKAVVETELERLQPPSDQTLRTALLELAGSRGEQDGGAAPTHLAAIDQFVADVSRYALARTALVSFARRLGALSDLAGAGQSQSELAGLARHWKHTRKRQLARVEAQLGFRVQCWLPPVITSRFIEDSFEAWEESAEIALSAVSEVVLALSRATTGTAQRARRAALEAELEALRTASAQPPPAPGPAARQRQHGLHRELFESAVRVREAWASVHHKELLDALADAIQAAQAARSFRSLLQKSGATARWLRQLFPAWGCTLLSLGNVFPAEQGVLDMAVIDEAGQCHPAYALSALLRAKSALVIGDVNQLEPVVELSADDERRIARGLRLECPPAEIEPYRVYEGSATSAQALADRAVPIRPTLVDHFRCQPAIAAISEALCSYGLVAHTPLRSRADSEPTLVAAVLHLPVDGTQERSAGSWTNPAELDAVLAWTLRLLSAGIAAEDIGIITPYRGQLERLWRRLRAERVAVERPSADAFDSEALESAGAAGSGVAVGTVHRFQGGERSIVLLTTCVTRAASLPFLNDRVNLVNVAVSRARDHLITIGHTETLVRGRYTRHLVEGATRLGG